MIYHTDKHNGKKCKILKIQCILETTGLQDYGIGKIRIANSTDIAKSHMIVTKEIDISNTSFNHVYRH